MNIFFGLRASKIIGSQTGGGPPWGHIIEHCWEGDRKKEKYGVKQSWIMIFIGKIIIWLRYVHRDSNLMFSLFV